MINFLNRCLSIISRNWLVYRKDFIANISPTIADPAFTMLALGVGLGSYVQTLDGLSYKQFLAPGLTVATALFTSFFESSYGFYVRLTYENIFKAMLTTPIGTREIFWGEVLWVGLKGAAMALGVTLVLCGFGMMENMANLPLIIFVGFLVAIPCGALGLIATALVHNINQFQTVYSFIIAPLYFLSGIFYPISQMNLVLKCFISFFPLIHGVALAQAVFWDKNIGSTFLFHGTILVFQSSLLCWIAYKLIKKKLIS
jgi:lipooligosaccharide transport system permease protein